MKRKLLLCVLAGAITGVCQMLGMVLTLMESDTLSGRAVLCRVLPAGILWTVLTACFGYAVWRAGRSLFSLGRTAVGAFRNPFLYQLIFLLLWLPCYLAYYPAIYSYDGEPQLIQYTTHAFDNHHPILHTLILGWCYDLGQYLQSGPKIMLDGMAVYAFGQMLLLSGAFAFCIRFFIRQGASKRVLILLTAWFGLFPVHPLMAVSTTKDTFFTAFVVIAFTKLTELVLKERFGSRRGIFGFFLSLLCLMLFRKNGVYLVAGTALAAAASFLVSMRKRAACAAFYGRLTALLFLGIVAFGLCDGALVRLTDAKQGEAAEALSVPLQQLSRTYKSNQSSMTADELEALYAYVPPDGLNNYRPYISDGVKQYFNNDKFAEDPAGFLKIWLALMRRYPGSYATAFLYHTMGAWYPSDVSHCRVYQNWWRDRTGYFITDAVPVFAGDFVKKENLLPAVRALYEKLATQCAHQRFLPTRLLFAPALYCLLALFVCIAMAVMKRFRLLIPSAGVMVQLLTVAAGPCILVRYVYPFMALLPLLSYFVFAPKKVLDQGLCS